MHEFRLKSRILNERQIALLCIIIFWVLPCRSSSLCLRLPQ